MLAIAMRHPGASGISYEWLAVILTALANGMELRLNATEFDDAERSLLGDAILVVLAGHGLPGVPAPCGLPVRDLGRPDVAACRLWSAQCHIGPAGDGAAA